MEWTFELSLLTYESTLRTALDIRIAGRNHVAVLIVVPTQAFVLR